MVVDQKGPFTVTIDIRITTLDPIQYGPEDEQLEKALRTIGFERRSPTLREVAVAAHEAGVKVDFKLDREETDTSTEVIAAHLAERTDAPKRERGQPSPGKARRTKAEIAEDEAAAAQAAEQPNISVSPEDRQDPDNPEPADDEETAAADAADEAAETAAAKTALTLDDVRNALSKYVTTYGMAAAQADGPKLIAKVLGKPHDDAAPCKISDLGEDQALLAKAIAGVDEMIAKDPFGRGKVAA